MGRIPYTCMLCIILLHVGIYTATAQSTGKWKKLVTRDIHLPHHPQKTNDSSLCFRLLARMRSGEIKAYNKREMEFRTTYDYQELVREIDCINKRDTTLPIDTNEREDLPSYRLPSYHWTLDSVKSYRILESWEYNTITGIATSTVIAIGVFKGIYVDTSYRGSILLFWIKYQDALPTIKTYDAQHASACTNALWQAYSYIDSTKHIVRFANLEKRYGDNIHEVNAQFHPIELVNQVSKMIEQEVNAGTLKAFNISDTILETPLTKKEISNLRHSLLEQKKIHLEHNCIIFLYDFNTGQSGYENYFSLEEALDYSKINSYFVLQEYIINKQLATITVKNLAIAPLVHWSDENPIFWLRYQDVRGILARYDEYYPENTFDMQVWDWFFRPLVPPYF